MSSTFLKSLSDRTPLLDAFDASKVIANPKPNDFIHPYARLANMSAEFLTPVAAISDQPRKHAGSSIVLTASFRKGRWGSRALSASTDLSHEASPFRSVSINPPVWL